MLAQFFPRPALLMAALLAGAISQPIYAQVFTVRVGEPILPPTPLVNHGEAWQYHKGTNAPQVDWRTAADGGLDGTWATGPGGFGYSDGDDATVLGDMMLTATQPGYSTVFIRKAIVIGADPEPARRLVLTVDYDDGFVAYLDGLELVRRNLGGASGSAVAVGALALISHEASGGQAPTNAPERIDLGAVGSRLAVGTHVLALIGVNAQTDSSDLSLIVDLELSGSSAINAPGYYTLVNSNHVLLSGTNTLAGSTRVVVNGVDAGFNTGAGTWSMLHPLRPGLNRLSIAALDANGGVLASAGRDVVYDLGGGAQLGGNIGTLTLDPGAGVVRVTNAVVITPDSTLTVPAGTVVLLARGASIRADRSAVIAPGTADNPVFFLPLDGTDNWSEISAAGSNSFITLKHTEVVGGQTTSWTNATALYEDCYFHKFHQQGATTIFNQPIVLSHFAKLITMRRCHVDDYYECLMRFGVHQVEDCLFEHIVGDGIDFDSASPGSYIRRCTFRHGNLGNVDAVDLGSGGGGTFSVETLVEDCLMFDFPFDKGVSIGEACKGSVVRNCLMYNCDSGVAIKDSSTATIYNCTMADDDYGFRVYEKIAGQGGGRGTNTYNNIIWNARARAVSNDVLSTIVVNYSDVGGTNHPGIGNFNTDPLFLNAAQHDYRVAAGSPTLGTGLNGANVGARFPVGCAMAPSHPVISGLLLDGANAVIRFWADNERTYTLQSSETVAGGVWTKVTDILPGSLPKLVNVTNNVTTGNRFYRLVSPKQP